MTTAGKRIMLVVGEASGDLHGAHLVRALLERDPTLRVFGVAGENLARTRLETLVSVSQITGMGLVELVGNLGNLWRGYRLLRNALRERKPHLLVLIDFPEFNLRLARLAKRMRIPVLYYISPQVWAWRKRRIRQIARWVDHMAVVFPFEAPLYQEHGLRTTFVGHPLLDIVHAGRPRESTLKALGLDPGRPVIALMPGSRKREVGYHLPVMLDAARRMSRECEAQFALIKASTVDRGELESMLGGVPLTVPIVDDGRYDALAACDVAWTASGTATLETALLLKPMIVIYRMSPLTFWLARRLVEVEYIGMVNILAGEAVAPELVQGNLTAERIITETLPLLREPELRRRIVGKLSEMRAKLGSPGAANRVADIALSMTA